MKCKHCGVRIKNNEVQWVHINLDIFYIHCSYMNIVINSQLVAEPIEEYETNDNFMEALKAL